MAATIELKVNLDYQNAFESLMRLDRVAQAISGTPYVIRVDVQGADKLNAYANTVKQIGSKAQQSAEVTARAQIKAQADVQQAAIAAAAQIQAANAMVAQSEQQTAQTQIAANAQVTNAMIASATARQMAETQASAQVEAATAQLSAMQIAAYSQVTEAAERTAQTRIAAEARVTNAEINAESKREQAAARSELQAQRHADRMEEIAARTNEATTATNALAVALGNIASRAFHMVVNKIVQGIREAVTEMKEVDTQLTNISKVSGLTGKALSDMGERAYETASRYGVAADEYLSAVYTFQKAGLGPSAEAMGELAVKTMLVGDTTADVASQFLISANAAWQLGGDIDRLNQLVDEADYINNNYATDLQKLSSGLPRVASVAAQAGMSAEETLAALGTITAVTQESGTKAATALRALILNIEGEIGEYVDETGEAFTVTEESVKSMQGLMEKYAKAEMDAAKASGELINPMTAIRAIFEGIANSDLNNQELFSLLSGMGGKLRTNQLTALVQNYELFDEMLVKIADSAGTADNEIALMMESWERKTQVLKNTWTEFIADIVNTDTIKGAIDDITALVRGMDSLVENASDPWYKSGETNSEIESTEAKIKSLTDAINELNGASDSESQLRLHDLEVELQIQQEILALKQAQYELDKRGDAEKLQKELTRGYLDSTGTYTSVDIEELNTLGRRLGNVAFEGNIAEYQENLRAVISDFSDYYDKVQQVKDAGQQLTAEQERFVENYELANNLAETQGLHIGELVDGYWQLTDSSGNVVAAVKDITQEYETQQEALEDQLNGPTFWEQQQQALSDFGDLAKERGEEVSQVFTSIGDAITAGTTELGNLVTGEKNAKTEADNVSTAAGGIDFGPATAGAQALARALTVANMMAAGISVAPFGFASGTTNAPGGETLVNELGPELISENGKAYIANGGKPAIVNLSKGAIVLPANVTKQALRGGGVTKTIHAAADGTSYGEGLQIFGTPTAPTTYTPESDRRRPEDTVTYDPTIKYWKCPKCGTYNSGDKCTNCGTKKPGTGGGGNGGKGDSTPKKSKKEQAEDAAKKLEKQLTNIDKRAQLAHTEKRYDDEQALYDKAIKLINAQIKRYRNAGYKNTSDEIVDLKNKRYSYKDKRKSAEQSKYDAEIEMLEAARDEQKRQDELAKREQAVADAQTALENAQRQRTVRVFNAATGQWEWVADQKTVQQAQERLQSAQESYSDTVQDQALDELKRRRDRGDKYEGFSLTATDMVKSKTIADTLGAVYGTAPMDTGGGAYSKLMSGDSHDTIYNFGSITLSEAEAKSTSVAELAKRLNVLKIS